MTRIVTAVPRAGRLDPRWILLVAVVAGVAPPACSAAQRPSVSAPPPRAAAWSFEAGLDPSLYVRFRGATYVEEPAVQWLAGAAVAPVPTGNTGRGALVRVVEDAGPGRPPELGRNALALSIPARGRVLVHTPVISAGGTEVHLAVWLRSEAPGTAALRIIRSIPSGGRAYGAQQQELVTREVEVGTRWTRAEVAARGDDEVYGQIEMDGARRLWLDGLCVGGPTLPTAPAEEMVIAVEGDGGVPGVVTTGAEARVAVTLSRALASDETLRARIYDPRGLPSDLPELRQPHGASRPRRFALRSARSGPLLVEVELVRGGQRVLHAERPLVALPPERPVALDRARVGTHTSLDARHLAVAARLGMRWLRLHDASMVAQWITVEPAAGSYRFNDQAVDLARRRGFALLGVLEATPRWASSAPANVGWYEARTWPPADPLTFARYVAAATTHYRGRIDRWEVWNEPYLDEFFHGSPADYRALLGAALGAACSAAPGAFLLASAAPEGPRADWTRAALDGTSATRHSAGGSLPGPAGFAFHPYDERLVNRDEPLGTRLATLREVVGEKSAGPTSRPLWASEGSVLGAAPATLDPGAPQANSAEVERAAAAEVAWAVDLLAGGAERVFVYQLTESPYRNDADLCLLEADGTPRPAAAALAILGGRVGDREPRARIRRPDGVQMTPFGPRGAAPDVVVIDRPDGGAFAPPPLPHIVDVWGNPISAGDRVHLAYASGVN